MDFEPQTERELQEELVWPEDDYNFEVADAVEKMSKSGNDMIELKITVFNADGKTRLVRD